MQPETPSEMPLGRAEPPAQVRRGRVDGALKRNAHPYLSPVVGSTIAFPLSKKAVSWMIEFLSIPPSRIAFNRAASSSCASFTRSIAAASFSFSSSTVNGRQLPIGGVELMSMERETLIHFVSFNSVTFAVASWNGLQKYSTSSCWVRPNACARRRLSTIQARP